MDYPRSKKKTPGFIVESEKTVPILQSLGFKVIHDPRQRLTEEMVHEDVSKKPDGTKDEFDFTAYKVVKPNRKK